MMHYWDNMPGWGWGGWVASTLMMLIFFGALTAVIVLLVRRPADRTPDPADQILAERFAQGDISEDEYQRRRQALHH